METDENYFQPMALLSRRATRPIDITYSEPTMAPVHNCKVNKEYQVLDTYLLCRRASKNIFTSDHFLLSLKTPTAKIAQDVMQRFTVCPGG